jgi:hypothetical protein
MANGSDSLSSVPPCSVTTSRGMIWMLEGMSASLVPVFPNPGTCCSGGPELLLFGPLPSSGAAAVSVPGFGGLLARVVRRRAVDGAAVAVGFGAARFFGAST